MIHDDLPNVGTSGPMTAADIHAHALELAGLLAMLLPPGEVVELRAPDAEVRPGWTSTVSGYFNDPVKLIADALRLTPVAAAVYVTLNAVNPALLARRKNRTKEMKKRDAATTDKDIVRRRWLLIDIDPNRPSGICATDSEKAAALALAAKVREFLTVAGWPDPLVIDSGNGVYLLYRIDLPTDDGGLVERCLKALAGKFDTPAAHIDQGVHKPSQLLRLPGTWNRKGDGTDDRPHREVRILARPDETREVPIELLEELSRQVAPPPNAGPAAGDEFRHRLDVERYLAHFGLAYTRKGDPLPDGRDVWRVTCPFDPSHTGTDANVMQDRAGKLGFRCFHQSCSGRGWKAFREVVGDPLPDHYDPPLGGDPTVKFTGDTTPNAPPPPPAAPPAPEWPAPVAEDAYHGLAGDIVRLLAPDTEADPIALLVQFLVMFGNVVGRNAHFLVEGTAHHTNLFAALVGGTSNGRKGTSHGRVRPLFEPLDGDWLRERNKGGISSAEGMLYQVRDADEKLEDEGEPDKRLMLTEPEFANVLKQCERQGNTVSVYLRQLWDGLPVVQTLTKNAPVKATDAHVSLIGHITPDELRRCLTATEQANGFANRHLFVCVRRSKFLPFGGRALDPLALLNLQRCLDAAAGFAQTAGRIDWHSSACPLWEAVYPILSGERRGLAGAMTARAAPITLRLAMQYALLGHSRVVRPCHLMAGLSVWDYAERSVNNQFGDRTGNPVADEIRELLRNAPAGLSRSELVAALGRHQYGDKLTAALNALQSAGLARCERRETKGRDAEIWHATAKAATESSLMRTAREALANCDGSDESDQSPTPPTPFRRFDRFRRSVGDTPGVIFSGTAPPEPPPAPPPPPSPAETWLVNVLRNGPRLKTDIDDLVKASGIPGVPTASRKLGIIVTEAIAGRWAWQLPDGFDLSRYPAPPEPPQPSLVDGIAPPSEPVTSSDRKAKAKRRKKGKGKAKAAPVNTTTPTTDVPPTADQVAVMLRKAKRPWSEVAACLDELNEYYPPDLEVHGLTGPQLALVAKWLSEPARA